jgi:hypothetical protein
MVGAFATTHVGATSKLAACGCVDRCARPDLARHERVTAALKGADVAVVTEIHV